MIKPLYAAMVCLLFIASHSHLGQSCFAQTDDGVKDLKRFIELQNDVVDRRVDFLATVTFVEPVWNFVFVQDKSDAVFIGDTSTAGLSLGDRVRVEGVGAKGDVKATIKAAKITRIRSGDPPKPIEVSVSDHRIGELDAQYVSVEGVVVRAVSSMDHTLYFCEENGVQFHVSVIGRMSVEEMWKMIGARMKFVGALGVTVKAGMESDDVGLKPREIEMIRVQSMPQQAEVITEGRKDDCPTAFLSSDNPKVFLLDGQVTMRTNDYFVLSDSQTARPIKFDRSYGFGISQIVRVAGTCSLSKDEKTNFDALVLESFFSSRLPTPIDFDQLPPDEKLWKFVKVEGRPEKVQRKGKGATFVINRNGQRANVEVLNDTTDSRNLPFPSLQMLRNSSQIEVTGSVSECGPNGECNILVPNQQHLQITGSYASFWKYFAWTLLPITALISVGFVWIKTQRNRVAAKAESIKEMHASLISTYRAIDDGLLAIDLNNVVLNANEKLCDILGRKIAGGERFSKDVCSAFLSRTKNEVAVENFLFDEASDNAKEKHILVEGVSPNSATYELSQSRILDDEKKGIGRLLIFHDQTRERQLQAELIHSNKIEAVGQLAGGIAHDFNNILTTIIANLSLLNLETDFGSRGIRQIKDAEMAAKRGSDLVRRLMTYTGKTELHPQSHSINKIIQELHRFARATFDARYEFKFEFDKTDPVVEVDAGSVEQVVLNLYLNARDAMPDGGTITTKTSLVKDAGETKVSVCVSDQAEPIPNDIQQQIFEPFFTTKAGQAGTGLGLSTSKRLILAQNGQLEFVPSNSNGNSFLITFPLSETANPSDQICEDPQPPEVTKPSSSKTILAVDDEDSIRKVYEFILSKHGFEVLTAAHGEAALGILAAEHEQIDMMLLDLTMPGMSGLDVIDVASELYPKIPVILCSGNLSSVSENLSDDIQTLPKPFSIDQLLSAVSETIQLA